MTRNFSGIRLGHAQSGKVLRYAGPSNLITIAPPRMGKSRDILMPFLLDYPYSVVVIDPKGEFAAVTGKRRRDFGEVIYLDPYDLRGKLGIGASPAASYNPMARLQAGSTEFSVLTEKISDALIWEESSGGQVSNHFTAGARGACSMIMAGLAEYGRPEQRNLMAMRGVLTGEFENRVDTFAFAERIMQRSTNQALRQKAAKFCVAGARESRFLADIISTADVQTSFLSDTALARSVSASDFQFSRVKEQVTTVFVTLDMNYLDVSGKYFRLIVASALSELLSSGKGVPTVILVDEAFQCGYLKALENAMSMSAGMGVQIWLSWQDCNQIFALYGKAAQSLIAGAGVRMFLTPRDPVSSDFLSNLCGQTEQRTVSKSVSMQDEPNGLLKRLFSRNPQANEPHVSVSFGTTARPLMQPHECRELPMDEMLLFIEGVNGVIRAKRRPYWDEPDLHGYEKNPLYT